MSENILIAYYSWSGNTRKMAAMIHEITGGEIIEICPQVPYPGVYNEVVNQAKKEIRNGFRPVLKPSVDTIDAYGIVFVGSPNWWSTIAPPVAAFLEEHDFSGKRVIPFCTHGGGGQGRIANAVTELCPHSAVADCMEIYGSGSGLNRGTLAGWIKNAGIAV
ncbi:MAG TPA: flavodoxin [Spirochaetota bacterium]|nr:flavodoxin [Spirochaetota bacterium]